MKKWLIKIAKKNAVLYRIAKKLYRSVRPAAPTLVPQSATISWSISCMTRVKRWKTILRHYAQVRRDNTRIVVVVHGHTLHIHRADARVIRACGSSRWIIMRRYHREAHAAQHRAHGLAAPGRGNAELHIDGGMVMIQKVWRHLKRYNPYSDLCREIRAEERGQRVLSDLDLVDPRSGALHARLCVHHGRGVPLTEGEYLPVVVIIGLDDMELLQQERLDLGQDRQHVQGHRL